VNVYEIITQKILDELDRGTTPLAATIQNTRSMAYEHDNQKAVPRD